MSVFVLNQIWTMKLLESEFESATIQYVGPNGLSLVAFFMANALMKYNVLFNLLSIAPPNPTPPEFFTPKQIKLCYWDITLQ